MHIILNIVSLSFLVLEEVQTANLLSEEECKAITENILNWEFHLLQVSLRDTNTALEVARILENHHLSRESRTLKGLLFVDICKVGIALKYLSSQLPL